MEQQATSSLFDKERTAQNLRLEELEKQLREAQALIAMMSEAAQAQPVRVATSEQLPESVSQSQRDELACLSTASQRGQEQCFQRQPCARSSKLSSEGCDVTTDAHMGGVCEGDVTLRSKQLVEDIERCEAGKEHVTTMSSCFAMKTTEDEASVDVADTGQRNDVIQANDNIEGQPHESANGCVVNEQSSVRMTLNQLMKNSLHASSPVTNERPMFSTTACPLASDDRSAENTRNGERDSEQHGCYASFDVGLTTDKQTLVMEPLDLSLDNGGVDQASKVSWRASFINSLLGPDSSGSLSSASDHEDLNPSAKFAAHSPNSAPEETDNLASALRVAAENGTLACLQLLIKQGANVNSTVAQSTALHAAAAAGKHSCVKALLDAGARPWLTDGHSCTAAHLAAANGHKDSMRLLLEQETTHSEKLYHSVLEMAEKSGSVECVQLLHQYLEQSMATTVQSPSSDTTFTSADSALESDLASTSPSPAHATNTTTLTEETAVEEKHTVLIYLERSQEPSGRAAGVTKNNCRLLVGEIGLSERTSWSDLETSVWQLLHQHWSDLCITPTTHSAPGYIYLSRSMQALFGEKLRAVTRHSSSRNSSIEQIKSPDHSILFGSQESSFVASAISLSQLSVAHIDDLGLGADSVLEYCCGDMTWSPDNGAESSLLSSPFHLCRGQDDMTVILKGIEQGRLDKLAYESLIPVGTLSSYLDKLLQQRQVLLSGPPSSGKSFLSSNLAYCLQCQLRQKGQKADLLRISLMGRPQEQDRVLAMLHDRGVLQADDGSLEDTLPDAEHSCILLVHSNSGSAIQQGLAELLSCIHGNDSIWVGGSSDAQLPRGLYHLRGKVYLLVTLDSTGPVGLDARSWHRFFHLRWRWDSEPLVGLLWRHLLRRKWSPNQQPAELRTASWVWSIWQRINKLFMQLSLQQLTIGPSSFMACPVNGSTTEVASWLVDIWNGRITPSIEATLEHDGNGHLAEKLLLVLVQLAFLPGCPLLLEEQASWLQSLHIGLDHQEVAELLSRVRESLFPIEEIPPIHDDPPSPSSAFSADSSVFEVSTPVNRDPIEVEINPIGWPGSAREPVLHHVAGEKASHGGLVRRIIGLRHSGRFSRSPSPSSNSGTFLRKKKNPVKKEKDDFFDILSRLQNDRIDSQRSPMPAPPCMVMTKPSTLQSHVQARHTAQRHTQVSKAADPRRTSMSNMELMTGCTPVGASGKHGEAYRLSRGNQNSRAPHLRLSSLPLHSSH